MARKNSQQGSNPNIKKQPSSTLGKTPAEWEAETGNKLISYQTVGGRLINGNMTYQTPAAQGQVGQSFDKMFAGGGGAKSGGIVGVGSPSLANLDREFSYQGVPYGDLPSYKVGQKGGSLGLDRLAMMMGGQIYNPYQFARMTSSGGASGEYPYKSALSAQEAGQAAGLQEMQATQARQLESLRGIQAKELAAASSAEEAERIALNSGFASAAEMRRYLRNKQSALLSSGNTEARPGFFTYGARQYRLAA